MADPIPSRFEFAIQIARQAGDLTMTYYRKTGLQIESKSDDSPVTIADRDAEQLLRERICERFPEDGILGEEFDKIEGDNDFQWILDPIDGTKAFISGVPLFGTLIGLLEKGQPVAGVCRFPALDEVVYAMHDHGTWWQLGDSEPLRARVRSTTQLDQALFCFTDVDCWVATERQEIFNRLCRSTKLARGWGDCYGHCLVATGRADLMVDPLLNPWDAAALVPIVKEAGGRFCDWTGTETIHGGNGISVVPSLWDRLMEILQQTE